MKILVSGASGLVGTALLPHLARLGFEVKPLVRAGQHQSTGIWWDTESGELNLSALNEWQPHAIVHLAGENIGRRWTRQRKTRIRQSRVEATERLASSLSRLAHPLSVFISASAIGYYGSRGDQLLTEASPPGTDFLADVVQGWEHASFSLKESGIRVVHLRFGMILSGQGGALAKMLPVFRAGLGGKVGTGQQWISWIARTDLLRVIEWMLSHHDCAGAYNTVSPQPVRNADFTRELARALNRPAFFPAPAAFLRLLFGEMAQSTLLASTRVTPQRLLTQGFQFQSPDLASALRAELAGAG